MAPKGKGEGTDDTCSSRSPRNLHYACVTPQTCSRPWNDAYRTHTLTHRLTHTLEPVQLSPAHRSGGASCAKCHVLVLNATYWYSSRALASHDVSSDGPDECHVPRDRMAWHIKERQRTVAISVSHGTLSYLTSPHSLHPTPPQPNPTHRNPAPTILAAAPQTVHPFLIARPYGNDLRK